MHEADLVVTISDTMRQALVARGIPPEKIRVIPNAVDADQFQPQEPDLPLKSRFGLSGRIVLGYISNTSERHGQDVAVRQHWDRRNAVI